MDWLKEIFEAHNQRIKSPIIGSIILAFIAWNWQPIFYVLFATESVKERLAYWDSSVSHWYDILIPAIVGFVFAALFPYVSLFGTNLAIAPTQRQKKLVNDAAHRSVLEQLKNKFLEEQERTKIAVEKEKQERALQTITDQSAQDDARDVVKDVTVEPKLTQPPAYNSPNLNEIMKEIRLLDDSIANLLEKRSHTNISVNREALNEEIKSISKRRVNLENLLQR